MSFFRCLVSWILVIPDTFNRKQVKYTDQFCSQRQNEWMADGFELFNGVERLSDIFFHS